MRFGYEKLDRVMWGIFIILDVVVLFLPKIQNWKASSIGPLIFFYIGLLIFQLIFVWRFIKTFTSLLLFREGILVSKLFMKPVFLVWTEISSVRGGLWSRGLNLSNEDQSIKVKISSDFRDFNYLLHVLSAFKPNLWQLSNPMTFYKSPFIILFFLIAGIFFTYLGGYEIIVKGNYIGILFLIFSLGGYLFVIAFPWKATIQGEGLLLTYFFRKQTIFADEVVDVITHIRPIPPFLLHFAELKLLLRNNKMVYLSWFNVGASIFYAFLVNWLGKSLQHKLKDGWLMLDKPVKIPSISDVERRQLTNGE